MPRTSNDGCMNNWDIRIFSVPNKSILSIRLRNYYIADVCLRLQDLLCYQLPEHPNFYSELVGCMEEGAAGNSIDGHATVAVLFNQFDILQMQRVVGNARCKKMLKSESSTFLYC